MKYSSLLLSVLCFVSLLSTQISCTQEAQPKVETSSDEELTRVSYMSEATGEERDLPFIIVAPQLPMYGMDTLAYYIRNRKREDIPQRLAEGMPLRPEEFPMPYPMEGAVQNLQIPTQPKGPRAGWFMVEKDLEDITENTLSEYRTDANRLFLTIIGFGSWYFASRHPELFAAIVPVVGYGHPELMKPIAEHQLPIWVFAGGRDQAVKPEYFYPGLNELESQGHENLRFTIHAGMGHSVWVRVFAGQDVYDWMLMHERGGDKSLEPESRN